MRSVIFTAGLWLALVGTSLAQQFERSEVPLEVRYSVVQGGTGVTLRLDKTTGRVWRLESVAKERHWVAIADIDDAPPQATGVNYQLTVSSEIHSATLVNVHSGATWVLEWAGRRDPAWVPVQMDR